MRRDEVVRMPKIIVEQARVLKKSLQDRGIDRPLWECIIQVQKKHESDPFRNLRL